MPYETRKVDGSENVEVINSDTKEVKATHEPPEAQEKADRQVELLHKVESDSAWDDEDE